MLLIFILKIILIKPIFNINAKLFNINIKISNNKNVNKKKLIIKKIVIKFKIYNSFIKFN